MITTKQLRQVADVWPGKTPAKASYENSGDAKILKFRDVRDDGSIDWGNDEEGWIDTRYVDTAPFVPLESDTILLTNAAHSLENIGKKMGYVERLPDGVPICFFVGELTAIRANGDEVLNRWLYLYLQTNQARREIAKAAEGAHLVPRHLKRISICFPKRKIQEAHLAILDTYDATLSAARAELEAARRTKTALLQTLFTRGVPGRHTQFQNTKWLDSPQSWQRTELRRIAEIEAGFTMGRDLSRAEVVEVPYLTVVNVQEGRLDLSNVSNIEIKVSELQTDLLQSGDVLVTEGGDRDKLGRGCIWQQELPRCAYQNHIFRIRFAEKTLKPLLFHYLLQTYSSKRYFYSRAKQTSNLCTINSRDLKKFIVAVPEEKEQEEMLKILQTAEAATAAIEAKITALERLKQSLLQNLLTGRLRVGA